MSSDEMKLILEKLEKLDAMESRQRSMEAGIINLGTRLEALENKVDERLQDTRLLWEGVQVQIAEIRREIQQGFRLLTKKVEILHEDVLNVRAEQRLLEKDVEEIKKVS